MWGRDEIVPGQPVKRKHFSYLDLEEYEGGVGMWRIVTGAATRQGYIDASSALMACPLNFMEAMRLALQKWPNSCINAFTAEGNNKRAWLGHAGCYLATGSPEETTRLGWHALDPAEQYAANDAADRIIREWQDSQIVASAQFDLFGCDDFA